MSFGIAKDCNLLQNPNAFELIEFNDEFLGIINDFNSEQK